MAKSWSKSPETWFRVWLCYIALCVDLAEPRPFTGPPFAHRYRGLWPKHGYALGRGFSAGVALGDAHADSSADKAEP